VGRPVGGKNKPRARTPADLLDGNAAATEAAAAAAAAAEGSSSSSSSSTKQRETSYINWNDATK
jgi:hypothetical protein